MSYNPSAPHPSAGQQQPGYPPYAPGPGGDEKVNPYLASQGPPPGYYDNTPGVIPFTSVNQHQHSKQFQQPIMIQPGHGQGGNGASEHTVVALNVPPGLEFLTNLDRLFVKQKIELLEVLLGCETNNRYEIKDSQGRDLFTAKEDTDCCTRNLCGPIRPFDLEIKDFSGREIIHLARPLACQSCCCPCWLQSLEVFSPPGQLAGTVEQEWSFWIPKFVVKNAQGEIVLRIKGPFCTLSVCGGEVQFEILSRDGLTQVGKISKKWTGLIREAFTDADNFGINFPMDLDVRMKAVMLGACFLIDFMYFEHTQ